MCIVLAHRVIRASRRGWFLTSASRGKVANQTGDAASLEEEGNRCKRYEGS